MFFCACMHGFRLRLRCVLLHLRCGGVRLVYHHRDDVGHSADGVKMIWVTRTRPPPAASKYCKTLVYDKADARCAVSCGLEAAGYGLFSRVDFADWGEKCVLCTV